MTAYDPTEGFANMEEAADARLLLFATGYILESLSEKFGPDIQPKEISQRTRSAASIITTQVGHDGCMAMEGYEVQDLLCRLSGLFTELSTSMRRIEAANAASLCSLLAGRLGVFCGRMGGGDKRALKSTGNTYKAAPKSPKMGR